VSGQLPIKMRIVQMLVNSASMWDYEIVERIQSEYSERFASSKRTNAYLSEMKASGLIEDIDRTICSVKDSPLERELSYRLSLTPLGVKRARLHHLTVCKEAG
jgi:hypothetical protein